MKSLHSPKHTTDKANFIGCLSRDLVSGGLLLLSADNHHPVWLAATVLTSCQVDPSLNQLLCICGMPGWQLVSTWCLHAVCYPPALSHKAAPTFPIPLFWHFISHFYTWHSSIFIPFNNENQHIVFILLHWKTRLLMHLYLHKHEYWIYCDIIMLTTIPGQSCFLMSVQRRVGIQCPNSCYI